jgi:hypothetical protein
MFGIRAFGLFAPILLAASSAACLAQSSVEPAWTSSTTTRVKPEMQREFEGYLKRVMGAYKQAGIPWFVTTQNLAGDTTEYNTVVPVMKLGDLDGPSVLVKVLGEEASGILSRNMARCYTSQTRQYATPQTAIEINNADVPMGIYWTRTSILVSHGKMDDYLNWLRKDYRSALADSGVAHFQVSRPIFGAEGEEVVSMRMLKNLAEIDEGPVVTKALGLERARAVNADSAALVLSSNTNIVRVRTDLTYRQAPPSSVTSEPGDGKRIRKESGL